MGNNSFLQKNDEFGHAQTLANMFYNEQVLEHFVQQIYANDIVDLFLSHDYLQPMFRKIHMFLTVGNRSVATKITAKLYQKPNYGFNELHHSVLKAKDE